MSTDLSSPSLVAIMMRVLSFGMWPLLIVTRSSSGLMPSTFEASFRFLNPFFSRACRIISEIFMYRTSSFSKANAPARWREAVLSHELHAPHNVLDTRHDGKGRRCPIEAAEVPVVLHAIGHQDQREADDGELQDRRQLADDRWPDRQVVAGKGDDHATQGQDH